MKIIITEEQFNFLFESNFEKNSRLVYKMWNDGMEFNEISDYTGLSLEQIIFLLKDKEIYIDCGLAYKLVGLLFIGLSFSSFILMSRSNPNTDIRDGNNHILIISSILLSLEVDILDIC